MRARLFVLLDEHILPEADRTVGRPGMDLWQILVLGVLKQGLGCDFDRLHDLTNHHQTIRAFLGHGDFDDKTRYEYQTVVDNVSLLTPELLSAVGRLVVEREGEDVDVAVSMVQEAQALYPELRACSFDRGFHSRDNRVRLDALLDVNALPGRGYLSRADREREEEESFVAARRAHPAIESAINGLEHRGLDRVRSHGADGFARTVALSVLAANLHRIGLILQKRERKRQRLVA